MISECVLTEAEASKSLDTARQTNLTQDYNSDASSRWVALLLGLMMILVPAVGVPSEEMLQDTLKSAIVSLMSIGAAFVFFWLCRRQRKLLVWHVVMWLPLMLTAYALGSMVWAHSYLGGVEAVRWSIFSLILWLGMNIRLDHFADRVLWGIHWGITLASIWAALQFWQNFALFPQGYIPASTFVNRNFFAEFAICALPFTAYLLVQSRDYRQALGLAFIAGFNVVALMMTGTRSALVGLIALSALIPLIYLHRKTNFKPLQSSRKKDLLLAAVFIGTVVCLGSIPTKNGKVIVDYGHVNAIDRAIARTASIGKAEEYANGSFSIRAAMWAATSRMIQANPVTGVGAGAWEEIIPLYQTAGSELETDFYAHNELLQLVAEYGLVGWLFIGLLVAYLIHSTKVAWIDHSETARRLTPLRLTSLMSMLMLLVVGNAGFPWRLASTGVLFALNLSLLAACDADSGRHAPWIVTLHRCRRACTLTALVLCLIGMALALYITQRAAMAERTLVRGISLALTISRSGNASHPYWDKAKVEMLEMMRQGIALNGHYRKLTPIAADELASMGDWENALWIWESIHQSRPYVLALITNIARANLELGRLKEAEGFLTKANQLQPMAPTVRSLNALLLFRLGNESAAGEQLKALFKDNVVDYELVHTAFQIGEHTQNFPLMIQSLELRIQHWPVEAADSWLKIGNIYASKAQVRDEAKALAAYRAAMAASPEKLKGETLRKIPASYWARL